MGGGVTESQFSGSGYMMDGNIFPNGHCKFEIHVRYPSRNNEKKSRFIITTVRVSLPFTLRTPFTVQFVYSFCIFVSSMRVFYK